MKRHPVPSVLLAIAFCAPAALWAAPPPKTTPPAAAQKAGNITALLPVARIVRGAGRATVTSEAKKGDDLVWQDLVKTEKGGRARITLADQSILSLGSQAELRIVKHDARSQQTALQLGYGRVRAQVTALTRDGSSFELRTPTAVAGVIGTDFASTAGIGFSDFACIFGTTKIKSTEGPSEEQCSAGDFVHVEKGKMEKKPLTQQMIQEVIRDTTPGDISAMAPSSTLVGQTIEATITGTHLAGEKRASVSGGGVEASLNPGGTETSFSLRLAVAANAQPGPRTVTFTKANGQETTAIFTVLALPRAGAGDAAQISKPYLDIIATERDAALGGLEGVKAAVGQDVDQALGHLADLNNHLPQPMSLTGADTDMKTVLAPVSKSVADAAAHIRRSAADTSAQFAKAIADAYKDLLQRPPGSPPAAPAGLAKAIADLYKDLLQRTPNAATDDLFRQSVNAAFDGVNKQFIADLATVETAVGAEDQKSEAQIAAVEQRWTDEINALAAKQHAPPLPAVDSAERSVQVGDPVSFDAGRSRAFGGESIGSISWVLCDPAYKPSQFGVELPHDDNRCQPVPGFAASGSQFQFQTCSLKGQDYVARVTVFDSDGHSSKMDVKLSVLPENYDPPNTQLANLAGDYQARQLGPFLGRFSDSFSGLTALQENIRKTFAALSSMNINLRLSQAAIRCNEANLRADWQQNYTFADGSCGAQATAVMSGVAPNQMVSQVGVTHGGVGYSSPPTVEFSGGGGRGAAGFATVSGGAVVSVTLTSGGSGYSSPPSVTFVGVGGFCKQFEQLTVRMTRTPGKGWFITDFQGDTGTVQAPPGLVTSNATINPPNVTTNAPIVPTGNFAATAITVVGRANPPIGANALHDGDKVAIDVTIANTGSGSPIGTVRVVLTCAPLSPAATNTGCDNTPPLPTATVPAPAAGTSVVAHIIFPEGPLGNINMPPGSYVAIAAITAVPPGSTIGSPFNQNFDVAGVIFQIRNLAFSKGATPFLPGQSGAVTFSVFNLGNLASSAGDVYTCAIDGGPVLASGTLPAIAPGASTTVTANFVVPAGIVGALTLRCTVSLDPAESTRLLQNNQATLAMQIGIAAYVIQSATFVGVPNPATGVNAIQDGTTLTLNVVVANKGSASPTGTIQVTAQCLPSPPCSGAFTTTINAPAVGGTATAVFSISFNLPPGSYTGQARLTTSIPQSSTAGNTLTVPFDAFDFKLLPVAPTLLTPAQNMKIGATSQISFLLDETGVVTQIPIAISMAPADPNLSYSFVSPMSPGSTQTASVAVGSAIAPGTGNITAAGTRNGVSRQISQPVFFYNANWPFAISNQPGSTSSNPLQIVIGATATTKVPNTCPSFPCSVNLQLAGNFSGNAALSIPPVTGFVVTQSVTSLIGGGTVTLQIQAIAGATPKMVTPIVIQAQIPNTAPPSQGTVTTTLYMLPLALPDLAMVSFTPVATGRNFTTFPWLSGEPQDFNLTIANKGAAASAGGELVGLFLNGALVGSNTIPSPIAPFGGTTTIVVHAVAPDPVATGSSSFRAEVRPSSNGDMDLSNNTLTTTIPTSDWKLAISGAGSSSTLPLLLIPGSAPSTATVTASANSGGFIGPITLVNGDVSTRVTETITPTTLNSSTLSATVSLAAAVNAISGQYVGQVLGQFHDGARVTATRQATTFVTLGTGVPILTTLIPSPDDRSATAPLQINGVLLGQLAITVTSSACATPPSPCPGGYDLHFSDQPPIISLPGAPLQQLKFLAYNTATNVQFAAAEDATGNVTPGTTSTIASVTAAQTSAVRTLPITPPYGTQTTLYFNIGDLFITRPSPCVNVPPAGGTATLTIGWTPVSGFNAPVLQWKWFSVASGVIVTPPSGSDSFTGSTYGSGSNTFTLSNSNPGDLGQQTLIFQVTVSNSFGSASKFFPVNVSLSKVPVVCVAANGASGSVIRGSWRQVPAAGAAASRGRVVAEGGLPDLQLSDASFSPSLPRPGDNVQVRFRVSNAGNAAAARVPIALQVDGVTVASDTFDVPAGKATLGGLEWANARISAGSAFARPARAGRFGNDGYAAADALQPGARALDAVLVIDPQHTVAQRSAVGKSIALRHLNLRAGDDGGLGASPRGFERALIEVPENACAGFRFSSGAASVCGSADLEIVVEDLANGRYALSANAGIADLGPAAFAPAGASRAAYSSRALAVTGHTYAVPLAGGRTGLFSVQQIRSPKQLEVRSRKTFNRTGRKIIRGLGGETGPAETGDTAAAPDRAAVYFDVLYGTR